MSDDSPESTIDDEQPGRSAVFLTGSPVHVHAAAEELPLVIGMRAGAPATAASAASPSDGTPTAAGQCCDAYPADVLTAALGTPVDAKQVWKDVGDGRREIARSLIEDTAKARIALLEKSAWATAPEMVLLGELGDPVRPELARKILEIRTQSTQADDTRRTAEAELVEQRVALAKVLEDTFKEANTQMRTWTKLAGLAKAMLVAATIFAAAGIAAAIVLAARGELGEVETPIIIFSLAVFAISPAVLLLRERPLEGLDKWTPSGLVGGESKDEGEGDGSGSGASSGTPAAPTTSA